MFPQGLCLPEAISTVYHKGPGVKKSGPKGPRTVKGPVLDAIFSEIEMDPSLTSRAIADRVKKKTGVNVSDSRIRQLWHAREKSRSLTPGQTEGRHRPP
jgi:hypothetical protein